MPPGPKCSPSADIACGSQDRRGEAAGAARILLVVKRESTRPDALEFAVESGSIPDRPGRCRPQRMTLHNRLDFLTRQAAEQTFAERRGMNRAAYAGVRGQPERVGAFQNSNIENLALVQHAEIDGFPETPQ